MVICLEQGVNAFHMVQLMPQTTHDFINIQMFTFLVPAHFDSIIYIFLWFLM